MKLIEDIVNQGHGSLVSPNPQYLFVHSTANPGATAKNHRDLYEGKDWQYAVQYVGDWTGVVYHTMPDNRLAWAVGNGNKYGVNLEICEGKTQDQFNKTWHNAVNFCAYYLLKRGWSIDRMMSHDECTKKWGGSDHTDPVPYFKKYNKTWAQFKAAVRDKMKTGVWIENNKGWWFMQSNGTWPKSKWAKLDAWYYFNNEGYAVTGWHKINGYWYYFGSDCRMKTGWQKINGKWYYLHPSKDGEWPEGSARIGWIKLKGVWYYLKTASEGTECSMACNETMIIDGKSYAFDKSGAMK